MNIFNKIKENKAEKNRLLESENKKVFLEDLASTFKTYNLNAEKYIEFKNSEDYQKMNKRTLSYCKNNFETSFFNKENIEDKLSESNILLEGLKLEKNLLENKIKLENAFENDYFKNMDYSNPSIAENIGEKIKEYMEISKNMPESISKLNIFSAYDTIKKLSEKNEIYNKVLSLMNYELTHFKKYKKFNI
ncbi:MAG: hypothetical protein PHN56_04195 [Candidatus Nanoarchaeia archaeon]|nr:hypothetical protein [Candidatus Nanoarchaeia archaeon]